MNLLFTGTQVNYFFICPTKLWFFSHGISFEEEYEIVKLAKLLHELKYYKEEKEVRIGKVAFDFIRKGDLIEIHELKKTDKMEEADYWQVIYYLYYLKRLGIKSIGFIHYVNKLKIRKVELNEEVERRMSEVLVKIKEIITSNAPPKPTKKQYCKKCSYYEFCWS